MTQTQAPQIQATAMRNGGGKFDHWAMAVNGTSCTPADCLYVVQNGNNATFKILISDPNGPTAPAQKITFSSDPISVPPTPKVEIHHVSGQGTPTLTFGDHNWQKVSLKYLLSFNNAPPIDPIIQNNGGGPGSIVAHIPTTTAAFAFDMGIALIAGAIIALLGRRILRGSF